ncbi:hypothetical protein [Glaciecola sp. 1036]|uniref:hypothetical protein n=1 Tax=Alteromonadaceae TaxID=72275 RepID=UPI003CFD3B3A
MSEENSLNQFHNKKNIMWVVLSGSMAVVITTLLFLPQQLGAGITSVYSLMLWYGLFGLTLFRYMDKKGAIGFLSGSVIGMLVHIFSPVIVALTA